MYNEIRNIEGIDILGPENIDERAGLISFNVPDVHPHDLGTFLDTKGIAIRTGHHCAMPLIKKLGSHSSARASFYIYNTKQEIDEFINQALYNPKDGYYMKSNPFGENGDFITSPNISILFSEMVSIWTILFWQSLKCPKKINLIELGSGNGQMIHDLSLIHI